MSLISIVIPCRNEEANIASTVIGIKNEFENQSVDYEILIVDDGSSDGTARVAEQLSSDNGKIRLILNNPPYGIGNAVKKGLEEYRGDYVIIAMADASDDPKDMVRYVEQVRKGYDCCFGDRWGTSSVVKDYPRFKYVINRMANWGMSILFQCRYTDITNAFKCYSRTTIDGIKPIRSRQFNITVELPLKAIVRGYRYAVIPTNWYSRKTGKSQHKLKEMGSPYLFIVIDVLLEKLFKKNRKR